MIGLAVDGVPKVGLITEIFERKSYKFNPKTYIGIEGEKNVFVYGHESLQEHKFLRSISELDAYTPDRKLRALVSKHHFTKSVFDFFNFFPSEYEFESMSGAGRKFLEVVEGRADCFMYNYAGKK